MKIDDLLAEDSPLTAIDDPRVRFYFDHYGTIEQWAALRREAASALIEGSSTCGKC
jgi:hypothetical protein